MKTSVINTRNIFIALVTLFTISIAVPATAGETPSQPVELKYIGKIKNQPVFELTVSGIEDNEFTVIIRDENNDVLYRENFKGDSITKKFMLQTEDMGLGSASVKFEVIAKKSEKTFVYQVNKNSRIMEDMVVNKIK
jgi:hypothetical protein